MAVHRIVFCLVLDQEIRTDVGIMCLRGQIIVKAFCLFHRCPASFGKLCAKLPEERSEADVRIMFLKILRDRIIFLRTVPVHQRHGAPVFFRPEIMVIAGARKGKLYKEGVIFLHILLKTDGSLRCSRIRQMVRNRGSRLYLNIT